MQNFIEIDWVLGGLPPNPLRIPKHPIGEVSPSVTSFPQILIFSLKFPTECHSGKVVFASRSHFVRTLSGRPINIPLTYKEVFWSCQTPRYFTAYAAQRYLSAYGAQWHLSQISFPIDFAISSLLNGLNFL